MPARTAWIAILGMSLALAAHAAAGPPAATQELLAKFAQPEETVEYHFMLQVAGLTEPDLARSFPSRIAGPLRGIADVAAPGECTLAGYADSPAGALEQHHLIVRVRPKQVTVKARAASAEQVLDLASCTSRKYEVDWFGAPEYSVSTNLRVHAGELDADSASLAAGRLWDFVASKCPELWAQIRPVVDASPGVRIPGVAHMYAADVALRHPAAARLKEAGLAVWFFPPTDRFLVELAFTGYEQDRAGLDTLYRDLGARLRAAGLLSPDQSSKTQRYFAAYRDIRR